MRSERQRLRDLHVWRQRQYTRIFFAIGVILAASNCLTLLPALKWSNINSNAAMELRVWYVLAKIAALHCCFGTD